MKKILSLLFLLCCATSLSAQNTEVVYDSVLAKNLGADDYGMKSYFFVILKTGPTVITDKSIRDSLFAGHLQNITRLVEEGKMIVAGPLGSNANNYRGIFIFDTQAEEDVKELLQTDPVISSQIMEADIYRWYGSAALPIYIDTHRMIQKVNP